jgi:hypothetical protein
VTIAPGEEELRYGPVGGSSGLSELLGDRIPKAASRAHRRYPAVPRDDFEQVMWERALAEGPHFRKLFEEGKLEVIWVELCRAGAKAGREDDRYRRAVKALGDGYSVYDIEFYSTRMLAHLLPVLIEAEFNVSQAMEKAAASTDAAGIHIRTDDPFGGAENYLVVLVDVTSAFDRLPEGMQRLLKTYYGVSQEDTEEGRWARDGLASSMGLTANALYVRVHRALQRLQDELGGADPWK